MDASESAAKTRSTQRSEVALSATHPPLAPSSPRLERNLSPRVAKRTPLDIPKKISATIDQSARLSGRYKALWESQKHADVVLLVGQSRKRVTAHSIILIVHSPVMEALILKHTQQNSREVTVVLPKTEPLAFESLLKFMYTGVVEVDEGSVLALLELAQTFQIDALSAECANFITDNIRPRFAVDYLESAAKLGMHLLYRHCLLFIQENFEKVSVSRSFMSLSEKSFDAIIRTHETKCNEVTIFKAVVAWGNHRLEQRSKIQRAEDGPREGEEHTIGDICHKLLQHVRYQLVSPQDIIRVVYPTRLVPIEQLFAVLAHHHLPQDFPIVNPPPPPLVEFDPSKSSEEMEISADNQTATLAAEKNAGTVVMVKKPIGEQSYVEVVCEKLQQPGYFGVGLCSPDISRKHIYCTTKSDRWMVYFSQKGNAKLFGPNTDGTAYGKPVQQGDRVGVQYFNSSQGSEVKFFLNGEELGVAFRNVPTNLYFCVFLYYIGDRVTLV